MRITEFRVSRYGQPLADLGRMALQDFNLFFGNNEDGKTLTIDAIVKMMLGAGVRDFQKIDRVDENPEGYVVIKDSAGKEYKLPEKGTLTKLTDLTPSECRNIFVIRNSDLSIVYPENDFYLSVMDKLVGLRAKTLQKIKESLRNLAKLTPTNAFKNDRDEKLKTRIDKAAILVTKIDEILEQIKAEDLDKLEIENVKLTDEISTAQAKLDLLEAARKREKYEKGEAALTKLKESLSNFEPLTEFNQNDEQKWRESNKEIETLNNEEQTLKDELKSLKDMFSSSERELSTSQLSFANLESRKLKVDEEIRPALKNYEEKQEKVIRQRGSSKLLSILAPLSTIVVVCSLVGAILRPSSFFYTFTGISGFLTVAMWALKYRYVSNESQLKADFENIKLKASQHGFAGENPGAILNQIGNFEQNFKIENEKLQFMFTTKETLRAKVNDLEDKRIPELIRRKEILEKKVEELKTKFEVSSIDEYSGRLNQKINLEKSIAEQEKALEALFEKKGQSRQENMANWSEVISEFSEFEDKAQNTKFDETIVTETREKQATAKNRQIEVSEKLASYQRQLEDIEVGANEILRFDESLYCRSCTDLEGVKKELENFRLWNITNRSNVLAVMHIFEEIEKEEKDKVSDLFGANSNVSKFFSQITRARYTAVHLDTDSGRVEVETKNGDILDADKLSSGSYDQLYLSIRLALGEKLLKGDKGFFIMDDPLIKADSERLQTQLNLLKQVSDLGWQIIYFTAKEEVKNALKDHISSGSVNLVTMPKL